MNLSAATRKRALMIATAAAVAYGVYFVRGYLGIILFAMIMAYLFTPIFRWFQRRTKKRRGGAAALTFLVSVVILVIPFAIVVFFTAVQLRHILNSLELQTVSVDQVAELLTNWANRLLGYFPTDYQVTQTQVVDWLQAGLTHFAQGFLNFLTGSVSSITALFVNFIIYVYVFTNLLMHQETLVRIVKQLNPLGSKASGMYLRKMGATTTAMVRGQLVIAVCQGVTEAIILRVAGVDNLFFFMVMLFTLLSVIPLGAGIVAIPAGIVMLFTGNIWQGVLVLAGHFLIVTNIDNVLRPKLVPKDVRLNSALTMLGVFAGIAYFGFIGIVVGPVIMILIVTTLRLYLSEEAPEAEPAQAEA